MKPFSPILLIKVLVFSLFFSFAQAQNWSQINKVVANDRTANDMLGATAAMSGNYAIVGSSNYGDVERTQMGAAYIFYKDGTNWTQLKKLTAPTLQADDGYGYALSISGDYAIVGARDHDVSGGSLITDAGTAYIYRKDEGGTNNWGLVATLTAPTPIAGDHFGWGVGISGNYVIVGAKMHNLDENGSNSLTSAGAAYIFERNTSTGNWAMVRKVTATTRQAQANFGTWVAIDGNLAVVAADAEDSDGPPLSDAGAVYVFDKNESNWGSVAKLTPSTPLANASFGTSVSISGDLIAMGSPGENSAKGVAYIFRHESGDTQNWTEVQKIAPATLANGDNFGCSVSISGSKAIFGAYGNDTDGTDANMIDDAGAAYIYYNVSADSWALAKKVAASERSEYDSFGTAVAISGNYAIVGSIGDEKDANGDNEVNDAGSAYIFGDLTALPVTLESFQVTKSENQALLRWTTSAEANTDYFEIQRSTNGKNWLSLDKLTAAKKSTSLLPYSYTDKQPNEGQNLYRLKMVDLDGTFAYSRIQNISFAENPGLSVYPNPAVSKRLFFTPSELHTINSVQISDLTGRTVLTANRISEQGLPINDLRSGLYMVRIRKTDDSLVYKKVVVME